MDQHEWDRRYQETELVWGAAPNRFVVEETSGLTPGRALDLAAGEGRNALWLADAGWRVTAVDFSAVALERGKRLAAELGVDVEWVHADAREYAPEPEAYDLALLAYLHLFREECARVLEHAVRALAPGGLLVSVGHDRSNLVHGTGGPQDPELLHDADRITADITGAAAALSVPLRMRRAGRVWREVTVDGEERAAIDALVVAARPPAG